MKNKLNETSKNVENMQGKLSEVFGNIGSKIAGVGKRILNLAASASDWKDVSKAIRNAVSAINKLWQSVSQVISMIWELLKPFIKWLIEGFIDRISEDIKNISITIMEVVGNIIDLIGNIWKSLEGLIDLVSGIFTGDWERAWKGAEKVVNGFLGTIKSSVNTVSSLINGVINMMIGAINTAIRALNRISFDLPDFLGGWHFGLNIPEIPKNWGNIPRLSKEQSLRAEVRFWHGSTINREAKKTSKLLYPQ